MCGIVGYVGPKAALGFLLEGLFRLEYRGYDSAGVAIQNGHGIDIRKKNGRPWYFAPATVRATPQISEIRFSTTSSGSGN